MVGKQRSRAAGAKTPALTLVAIVHILALADHLVVCVVVPVNGFCYAGAKVDADDVQVQIDNISVGLVRDTSVDATESALIIRGRKNRLRVCGAPESDAHNTHSDLKWRRYFKGG